MLRALDIRDMLIINRLELAFQPGLNVLTGETGAGKSILLDSLGFVLGWRGRAELVRRGAERGEVTAVFDLAPGHPARAVLDEAGIAAEDELILRRVNARDGRKTAWINGTRASGEVLRQVSDTLVELHGQHDDRGLLNPRGHRDLLDAYLDRPDLTEGARAAWSGLRLARRALQMREAEAAKLAEEEAFLRHAAQELDALDPQPGEAEELDAARRAMQAAARIGEDIAKAHQALGYDGAEGLVGQASRWLDGAAARAEGRLDAAIEAVAAAVDALGEAESAVARALDELQFDPRALEETEERLFALRGLARKHAVAPDDLATLAEEMRAKIEALDASVGDLEDLRKAEGAALARYERAAQALSAARAEAAGRLATAMLAELAPLKMERAGFEVRLSPAEAGPNGTDDVTFLVATNPGAPAGPLDKIASGGELSRFLLALKVCLTGDARGLTMIFDEIDRGVGGATADAVGRRLAALAQGGQVLVVTHSPQVAALGGHHWRVEKRQGEDETISTVVPLDRPARVDEIARMLSGETLTDAARDAARALIAG
ncbi:MAG: DNA repair protein RecN [Paracoccaceae bacterium]